MAIHEILDRFAVIEHRKAQIVKLRYFIGMAIEEAAEALGISVATAKRDWVWKLRYCGFPAKETLAETLDKWSSEIACMWRFTKNNGITEGFHTKMEVIQRRAYGFKNFTNYRLRVIELPPCGWNHMWLKKPPSPPSLVESP